MIAPFDDDTQLIIMRNVLTLIRARKHLQQADLIKTVQFVIDKQIAAQSDLSGDN